MRTTELAFAFNDELEKRGCKRLKIIVPLVYGDKQKTIMAEEFSAYMAEHSAEIILDVGLGKILKKVFYEGKSFSDYLNTWVKKAGIVSTEANKYLRAKYGKNIKVELNRSPRISYDVASSYFTSFGYIGEILEKTANIGSLKIPAAILDPAVKQADLIEKKQKIHCLAFPGTFSYLNNRKKRYRTELEVPPLITPLLPKSRKEGKGIFVTVSGIPGLEKLYSAASKLGLRVYSNDPDVIPGSIKTSPKVIVGGDILLHFARAGWNSVWLSLFSETPLIIPDFDPSDDPEIYFNNISIQKLGMGIVYRGQTVEELLGAYKKVKNKNLAIKKGIINRWGTFDGTKYCAKIFVNDYLKNSG